MTNLPKAKLTSLPKPPPPLLENLRTGEWLNQQEFPPLDFTVPGVIPEGSTLLVGPPKVGKSWLALGLSLSVSEGSPALGSIAIPQSRPVLLFALEDSDRRMKERIHSLRGRPEAAPSNFSYITHVDPNKLIDTMNAYLHEKGSEKPLIILDTLGKSMPPSNSNESLYQRDYRIGASLKSSVDQYPGSSLIIIHHNRKAESQDFVDSVSGSNGLAGSADTICVISRQRHEDEAVLNITGRDVEEQELALVKENNGAWRVIGESSSDDAKLSRTRINLGDRSQECLEWIADQGSVTSKQAIAKYGSVAYQWLSRFNRQGHIRKQGRGVYEWAQAS